MRIFLLLVTLIAGFSFDTTLFAGVLPDAADNIVAPSSIDVAPSGTTDIFDTSRDLGLRILMGFKILVSGFALIYIIIMGVTMIVFSENEEKIKAQRRQMAYLIIGFLFLNIPGFIYVIFFGDVLGSSTVNGQLGNNGTIKFWDEDTLLGVSGFIPAIIGFFEIFAFGIAILTFTWGLFRLLMSGGNEEIQKKAKNRILNGFLGLIFFGFVKVWGSVVAKGDFFGEFATLGNKILGLALYFAAPVVVGFLALASFYMITAAGDEEKVKKAKSIFLNTLIATIILLGAYSFVTDLANFTL